MNNKSQVDWEFYASTTFFTLSPGSGSCQYTKHNIEEKKDRKLVEYSILFCLILYLKETFSSPKC